MTPESITAVAALVTAILGGLAGMASSRSQRARDDVAELRTDVKALTAQVNALSDWQIAARGYITTLRGVMADHGITAPQPPPELGLSTTQQED